MDAESLDAAVSRVAAAIAEPARTRILYRLMDGRARTSTELAVVADVSPATASVHLAKLKEQRLVNVHAQGRHRYYSLEGSSVAAALEALSVLAGVARVPFTSSAPSHLTVARTCYDHMAGTLAVAIHDRFRAAGWLRLLSNNEYDVNADAAKALRAVGLDIDPLRSMRRRFACACLDWSERQPHLGGALGASLLKLALERKWVTKELDSRALRLTSLGRREMKAKLGLDVRA